VKDQNMKATASADKATRNEAFADYYSATQLRSDRWSALKGIASQLAATRNERGRLSLSAKAHALLDSLRPMEMFWAFPGRHGLDYLTRKLNAGKHDEFSQTVARIVRALLTGSYRRNFTYFSHDEDDIDFEATPEPSDTVRERGRPYFEVLVVDAMTPEQEEAQRHSLHDMRRNDDQFIYEPVVVPSFEDALIAVLFNHNIQTVVVRYDFLLESSVDSDIVQRYLKPVDANLGHIAPEEYGPELCRQLRNLRPELH